MQRLDRWIAALWAHGKLRDIAGAIGLALLVIIVLVALAMWAGVDVGGYVNRLLGLP